MKSSESDDSDDDASGGTDDNSVVRGFVFDASGNLNVANQPPEAFNYFHTKEVAEDDERLTRPYLVYNENDELILAHHNKEVFKSLLRSYRSIVNKFFRAIPEEGKWMEMNHKNDKQGNQVSRVKIVPQSVSSSEKIIVQNVSQIVPENHIAVFACGNHLPFEFLRADGHDQQMSEDNRQMVTLKAAFEGEAEDITIAVFPFVNWVKELSGQRFTSMDDWDLGEYNYKCSLTGLEKSCRLTAHVHDEKKDGGVHMTSRGADILPLGQFLNLGPGNEKNIRSTWSKKTIMAKSCKYVSMVYSKMKFI